MIFLWQISEAATLSKSPQKLDQKGEAKNQVVAKADEVIEDAKTAATTDLTLKDEGRLIFDLGDITINFIPVIIAAKLILGLRKFFFGQLGSLYTTYMTKQMHDSVV